jgi:hypothetical protein
VACNPKGRHAAWDFYKSKASLFQERYKTGMLHTRVVKSCTENFATAEKAEEVMKFFADGYNPAERTVQQGRNSPIIASTRFLTGQATNQETIFLLRDLDLNKNP